MVKDVDFEAEVEHVAQQTRANNAKRDVKSIIHAIMESPVNSKYGTELEFVDGVRPLDQFKGKALDAQTLLLLNITNRALKSGDVKMAEFLMKYGGYEPPKQQQLSVELPQFVDDIIAPAEDTRNVHAKAMQAEKEAKDQKQQKAIKEAVIAAGVLEDTDD